MENLVSLLNKDSYFETVAEVSYTEDDNLEALLQRFKVFTIMLSHLYYFLLQSSGIRIIVGLFDSIDNEKVLCQVSQIY